MKIHPLLWCCAVLISFVIANAFNLDFVSLVLMTLVFIVVMELAFRLWSRLSGG